jgi:nucleoporin SEH1
MVISSTKSQTIEVDERTSHRDKLAYSSASFYNGDLLPTLSSDTVLDMCLDHYGQRLAVSFSDGRICVWDLDCSTGQWVCSANTESEWQTGTIIHQLRWAHPNFGQILASAGSDHILILWEECEEQEEDNETQQGTDLLVASTTKRYRWVPKVQLNEARAFVTCIGFAPPHLGLKVAAGSADGMVRIYEATDIRNLYYWPLYACIDVDATTTSTTTTTTTTSSSNSCIVRTEQPVGVTCLAWSTRRLYEPPTLAVGTSNGTIALYRYSDTARQWLLLLQFPAHMTGGVVDIAWAPNMGRNFIGWLP